MNPSEPDDGDMAGIFHAEESPGSIGQDGG